MWQNRFFVLLFVKFAYLACVFAALCVWPTNLDAAMFERVMRRWPIDGAPVFASHFATWDGSHYLYLSQVGYPQGGPSSAFYPLWPLLVRWFSLVTGGSHLIAGLVLANMFSLGAFVLFHRLLKAMFGAGVAALALVLLVVFPGSLFYQFIYSESLFFLLVMVFWWGLVAWRRQWVWLAGCLLPLSRPSGIFCLLPLGWLLLRENPPQQWVRFETAVRMRFVRWRGRIQAKALSLAMSEPPSDMRVEVESTGEAPIGTCERVPLCGTPGSNAGALPWWLMAGPFLGWFVYLGLMWSWTGDPFEGFKAQRHWGAHSIGNLVDVPKFVIGYFAPMEWHAFKGSLLDRCVFFLLFCCLPLIWKLDKTRGLFVWTYVLGILPAMSGTFTSFTRYASTVFPMFIALAVFLGDDRRKWLRWATYAVFGALHIVLLCRFVNFRWAG